MIDLSNTVFIYGGNEIASAAAIKLFTSGFDVLMFADPGENLLRYHLCLGDAIQQGQKMVEDITAAILPEDVLAEEVARSATQKTMKAIEYLLKDRTIPVLHSEEYLTLLPELGPRYIFNASLESSAAAMIDHASLVIGLLPRHQPGVDCHLAVESRLNYYLGRAYSPETLLADDPQNIDFFKDPFGYCKTPVEGVWLSLKAIGEPVRYNEALGKIGEVEIRSPYDGQIWGLAHSGKIIPARSNVALIYQGRNSDQYRYLSFRENAIAGGVLHAILQFRSV